MKERVNKHLLWGELIGTFILVFIGCSSVAIAILEWISLSLLQIAIIWGLAVFIAIKVSSRWSGAHLNPAVTFAFHLLDPIPRKKLLMVLMGQALGAFIAGGFVLIIFYQAIEDFEVKNNIVRGLYPSYKSAVMFGEFYPNPGFEDLYRVSEVSAMLFEGVGTMILMLVILLSTKLPRPSLSQPLAIACTLAILIYFIAPFTQAGFNPFRDFMPRMVAFLSGWGIESFPLEVRSAFTVYIFSPIIGACTGSFVFKRYLD